MHYCKELHSLVLCQVGLTLLSHAACCLWSAVGQAVVYGTITYALICLEWTAYKFWYYILFTVLTILFFTYYGEMSVAVSPSPQLAAIMSSAVYSVWFIFAGALQLLASSHALQYLQFRRPGHMRWCLCWQAALAAGSKCFFTWSAPLLCVR